MGLTFYNNKLLRHPGRLVHYLYGDEIVPLTLDIDLTNRCNSKCPECVGARQTERETLDAEIVRTLLAQASAAGVQGVVFTGGGEPTLHPDLIDMLDYADNRLRATAVVTNGVLLSDRPDIVDAVVRYCTWVRISVDAGDREMYVRTHGVDQYEKVILGLKALSDEKKRQHSQITIGAAYLTARHTIDGIDACCEDVEAAGVDYFYLRPFLGDTTPIDTVQYKRRHNIPAFEVITSWAYQHLEDKQKTYSKCGFGWWVSVVMADGTVTWCCRMRGNRKYTLGNIYDDDLRTILEKRRDIQVDFRDCTVLCRGDQVNKFLQEAQETVMHEAFL